MPPARSAYSKRQVGILSGALGLPLQFCRRLVACRDNGGHVRSSFCILADAAVDRRCFAGTWSPRYDNIPVCSALAIICHN